MVANEKKDQIALFQWIDLALPDYRDLIFHIPNGERRHIIDGVLLKRMGVRKGVPDIFIAIPKKGYNGCFVELKSKKGKITDAQERMIFLLKRQNYHCVICFGWEQARDTILEYFNEN